VNYFEGKLTKKPTTLNYAQRQKLLSSVFFTPNSYICVKHTKMQSFSKSVILSFLLMCFTFNTLNVKAENEIQKQNQRKSRLENPASDTIKVNELFELGYQFINGPSDSLLFYFEKALKIIQNNLVEIEENEGSNRELITTYRNFEIRALIEFGIEYFYKNEYSKAIGYFNNALEVAKVVGNSVLISECMSEIGIVYKNQGDYNQALNYYNQALKLAKQSTDTSWIASCQINIGNVYKEKGFLNIAQKHYLEALKIMETLGENRRIAACYQNIGDIYNKQLDYDKALEYFNKSLELASEENDKVRQISIYLNTGDVHIKTGQYKTARSFLQKAILLYDETGYQHERDFCNILMGNSWLNEGDHYKAIEYYEKALEISQLKNDKTSIAEIEGNLGQTYFYLQDYQKALELFTSSLETAEGNGSLELMIKAKSNISNIYKILNQPHLALQYFREYSLLKDSLFNAEKYKAIKEMEVKYESEKNEQQLDFLTEKNEIQDLKLSRRNRMLFALIAIIALLILVGFLLRKQNLLKSKHNAIELEQRLLRSQMNPHFIFNSLIAIQSYIYKKEPVAAGDYLAKFAELVRLILENSRVEYVSLKKEIETLENYLELQSLRFEKKFDFSVELLNNIEPENTMLPPMFAQPFIENAIEHGLRHKPGKGNLKLVYSVIKNCCIKITIEDDGIGREKAGEIKKREQHRSLALDITKERLTILSKKHKYKFLLKIIDLKDESGQPSGTKVEIMLPYKLI
jgi:tetratricopeptide (TPR) repeat protein